MRPTTRILLLTVVLTATGCAHTELATKPMSRDPFAGEESGEVWGTKVAYLDQSERVAFALEIHNGKLLRADGSFLHCPTKPAIFVLAANGTIYASTNYPPGMFHHSSFMAGSPVAGAGELWVEHGRLVTLSNRSGHYRPGHRLVRQTLELLQRARVDLSGVLLKLHRCGRFGALDYLNTHSPACILQSESSQREAYGY